MTDATSADGREHPLAHVRRAVAAFEREDPKLTPPEKETALRFARDEERVTIYTAERGIGRRVLAHPAAAIDEVTIAEGRRKRPAVPLEELEEGDQVVAVRGTLPLGTVKVRERPRTSGGHADVVTKDVLKGVTR